MARASVQWKSFGEVVFDVTSQNGVRRVGKVITNQEFMELPDGIGGAVGVIPWYTAMVKSHSGTRKKHHMVRLGVSNHMYLTDFGGGFKKNKTPYDGLVKEVEEEIPQWKSLITKKIKEEECLFLLMEQSLSRSSQNKKSPIPVVILIFVPLSAKEMDNYPFTISSEIRAVTDRTIDQFHSLVDHQPTVFSDRVRAYAFFRKLAPQLLDTYFYSENDPSIEFWEKNLKNSAVQVVLGNNKTTRPFSEIIRENVKFSQNMEKAWKKREAYGKKVMDGWEEQKEALPPPKAPPKTLPKVPLAPSRLSFGALASTSPVSSPSSTSSTSSPSSPSSPSRGTVKKSSSTKKKRKSTSKGQTSKKSHP